MSRAALLAAVLLAPGAPPASIDFGSVQLGRAGIQVLGVHALGIAVSGAGFSATRARAGVVIVFEPYELHERSTGAIVVHTRSGVVRIALRGHGIDTIPPRVTVEIPHAVRAGRPLTIRFAATDNDLVTRCTLEVGGRVIGRRAWPASTFRWRSPGARGETATITVVAVDRAGNRASVTSRAFRIR